VLSKIEHGYVSYGGNKRYGRYTPPTAPTSHPPTGRSASEHSL